MWERLFGLVLDAFSILIRGSKQTFFRSFSFSFSFNKLQWDISLSFSLFSDSDSSFENSLSDFFSLFCIQVYVVARQPPGNSLRLTDCRFSFEFRKSVFGLFSIVFFVAVGLDYTTRT